MAQDQRIESWFRANGITFRYVADVKLSRIDKDASLRNQARLTEVLDDDLVLSYCLAMESGAEFPPLVGYDAGGRLVLVGGNHRVAAADLAKRTTFDMYLVEEADSYTIDWMTRLMNSAIEGKAPSHDEAVRQAVLLVVTYGKTAAEVAARGNLRAKEVESAVRLQKTVKRAEGLGIKTQRTPASVLTIAQPIPLDKPFAASLALRESTGMRSELFKELVKNVTAARGSEQAMLDEVTKFSHDPRVKQAKVDSAGGRVRPSTQVRHGFINRLTALVKFVGESPTPESLQLTSGTYLNETSTQWRELNRLMEGVFHDARKSLRTGTARISAGGAKRR